MNLLPGIRGPRPARSILASALVLLLAAVTALAQDRENEDPAKQVAELAAQLAGDPDTSQSSLWKLTRLVGQNSKPGSPEVRQKTAMALFHAITELKDIPTPARAEMVRLLGAIATDNSSILGLAAILDNVEMAESALFAFERIGTHPQVERILIGRLQSPGKLTAASYARALGSLRSIAAVEPLLALTSSPDAEAARAARGALARIGDVRAEPVLRAALNQDLPAAADDLLGFLDLRAAAARATLERTAATWVELCGSPSAAARLGGVKSLAQLDAGRFADLLIVRLADDDPEVARAAESALAASESPLVSHKLAAAEAKGDAMRIPALLRTLIQRKGPTAEAVALAAAEDVHAGAHVAALSCCAEFDDARATEALRRAVAEEDGPAKSTAANALLRRVRRNLENDRSDEAVEDLARALPAATEHAMIRSGIRAVETLARPSLLESLEAHEDNRTFQDGVAKARVKIADRLRDGDPARAAALYDAVLLRGTTRELRRLAAEGLTALGRDTSALAGRSGFLCSWKLLAPLPKPDEKTFSSHPFGDDGPNFDEKVAGTDGVAGWVEHATVEIDGLVDLKGRFAKDKCSAFAATSFSVDEGGDYLLKIGSDDGVAVWLDGKQVHSNPGGRGLRIDQDVVKIQVTSGSHRLLLLVTQEGGGWEFCVRLCSADGKPLDLSK